MKNSQESPEIHPGRGMMDGLREKHDTGRLLTLTGDISKPVSEIIEITAHAMTKGQGPYERLAMPHLKALNQLARQVQPFLQQMAAQAERVDEILSLADGKPDPRNFRVA